MNHEVKEKIDCVLRVERLMHFSRHMPHTVAFS